MYGLAMKRETSGPEAAKYPRIRIGLFPSKVGPLECGNGIRLSVGAFHW